ncbi:MAG: hypothetical protein PUC12_09585 [Clostridiales bacterium]|nr:hypothetical protein [Clostridiales bacterium]
MSIMDFGLEVSEESYRQEKCREEVLKGRIDYLFRWLTLFVSVFNIAVPIIVKETSIDYKNCGFIILYVIIMILLVTAMTIIVCLEFPKKVKIYPLGSEILKKAKEEPQKYKDAISNKYQKILYRDTVTRQIQKNNDKTAELLKTVNVILIGTIICMAIFFVYVVWAI